MMLIRDAIGSAVLSGRVADDISLYGGSVLLPLSWLAPLCGEPRQEAAPPFDGVYPDAVGAQGDARSVFRIKSNVIADARWAQPYESTRNET